MAVATEVTPMYRVEAVAFDAYTGFFRALPFKMASDAGASLLRTIGPIAGSPNRTALRNLRLAFPNETEAWRADVARGAWSELGRTWAELPHMYKLSSLGPNAAIEVEGRENFEAARNGAVFIAGHFSNWEAMAIGLVQSGITTHVTYRPANNPLVDARIKAARAKYGVQLQSAKGVEGGVGLIRALKRGESVVLMNDQKYNEGVSAPLFGHDCKTADGPTRMALRNRVPLIPLSLQRAGNAIRFRMRVHPPLPLDYDAPPETEIPASVRRINAFMEARIREAPSQWFWVHQRWPKDAWQKAGVM